jgi:hypothetical protein
MLASAVLVGGCASRTVTLTLNIAYDEAAASRGPLSSVEARRIQVASLTDKLDVTTQIGYVNPELVKAKVHTVSSRPVLEIVRDALVAELEKNGHVVNSDAPDAVLSADINEFWFRASRSGIATGVVSMSLTVTDGRDGRPLLTRNYRRVFPWRGAESGLCPFGFDLFADLFEKHKRYWQCVMNAAVQRMMRDLATDQKLVEALKRLPASR